MAVTWSGWQADFLTAAGIIVTPPNMDFLTDWHTQEGGGCNFNPVDLAHPVTGSTRCGATVTPFGRTQNYATHAQAEAAFRFQMNASSSKALKAALNSGNPFQIGDRSAAIASIKAWGSPVFAEWYKNATSSGSTGGKKGAAAPSLMSGWHALRRSMNRNWKTSLSKGDKELHAALRSLSHSRKVRP